MLCFLLFLEYNVVTGKSSKINHKLICFSKFWKRYFSKFLSDIERENVLFNPRNCCIEEDRQRSKL
mgnify:CR=1 FL=1